MKATTKLRLAWKYRAPLWKYRGLLRHRRQIMGWTVAASAVALGILVGLRGIETLSAERS